MVEGGGGEGGWGGCEVKKVRELRGCVGGGRYGGREGLSEHMVEGSWAHLMSRSPEDESSKCWKGCS